MREFIVSIGLQAASEYDRLLTRTFIEFRLSTGCGGSTGSSGVRVLLEK
ncbi:MULTISPECIES: hypothetical protein [unclassified Coleofasciculus]|nr:MULTISPECIES: hypothetical protein [unclassified Coleofasciculus]MBE9128490.1 hypothetical protein [Coleofasciculus sp. LEGE 07081]MBE9148690.1 hypothetical protein [Coleofasciculus sp. LEGE 07092]